MPVVGVTTWRRRLATVVADDQLLYTLAADYVDCLDAAGALPVLLPVVDAAGAEVALARCDGLLISGGDDVDPACYGQRPDGARDTDRICDESDIALIREARRRHMPTLGICRGLQVLNVALGGTLRQEVTGRSDAHPTRPTDRHAALTYRHRVHLAADSALALVFGAGERSVTSLHHQGVGDLAGALTPTAWAEDGLVEGAESVDPSWWALAVQWHPEKMGGRDAALFDAFAAAAQRYATGTGTGGLRGAVTAQDPS